MFLSLRRVLGCGFAIERRGSAARARGTNTARERKGWAHVHARALRAFSGIERVIAVTRKRRWKCAAHHFLDATPPNRFAFNHDAFKLLDRQGLSAQLNAARRLPHLLRSVCGPVTLDDDHRAAIGEPGGLGTIGRLLLSDRSGRRDQQQRPPSQMPAYH